MWAQTRYFANTFIINIAVVAMEMTTTMAVKLLCHNILFNNEINRSLNSYHLYFYTL